MSNFIEGLLETIHKNTSTNDLHQINTLKCRKAIETYIKEFGLDQFMKVGEFGRYNTMVDVAFSVEHDYDDPYDIPLEVLIAALEKRIETLKSEDKNAAKEAFGFLDTYEVPR